MTLTGQWEEARRILRKMTEKNPDCLKQMMSRNTDVNNYPSEDSEESEDHGREHI